MRDPEVIKFEEQTRFRALGQLIVVLFILISPLFIAWGHDVFRTLDNNVFILGKKAEGMNRWQVEEFLQDELSSLRDSDVILKSHSGGEAIFSYRDLGIHYAISETVSHIFDVTSWWYNITNVRASSDEQKNFDPIVLVDQVRLRSLLDQYLSAQERLPKDARISFESGQWQVEKEASGWKVQEGELERLSKHISDIALSYDAPPVLKVRFHQPDPNRYAVDLESLHELLLATIEQPIEIVYGEERITLDVSNHDQWLTINYEDSTAGLNEAFLRQWIEVFANQYDFPAPDVIVKGVQTEVSEYDGKSYQRAVLEGDFSKGRKLHQDVLLRDIRNAALSTSPKKEVFASWDVLYPQIISEVEGLDFPQLLSEGRTDYSRGSYPERVQNIKKSLEVFTGVIIPAGEEFSFNRISGWITEAKGYYKTKVIIGGEVKEGVGGGVCQSSTTMYRSIVNAGMPLIEHKHHSLDVVYYHKYGYGLDATVYQETLQDLRFVNDTPGPVLLYGAIVPGKETVMEFYGTSDGRQVELTQLKGVNHLHKKWSWKISKGDKVEERIINTVYQPEKKAEEIAPTEI